MKRSKPNRDWRAAIEKRDSEGRCRWCGITRRIEAAHILGREHDHNTLDGHRVPRGVVLTVWPERIVPLCGPATDPTTCHGKHDGHRLDLANRLTPEEQAQAVRDAGGIELARVRLLPSAYDERKVAA